MYDNDCDNYFHMKDNVYNIHEYDDDKQNIEHQLIQENEVLECLPIFIQHLHTISLNMYEKANIDK